jgi:hypothetical protein
MRSNELLQFIRSCRWQSSRLWRHVPPKRRHPAASPHGVTTQTTNVLGETTTRQQATHSLATPHCYGQGTAFQIRIQGSWVRILPRLRVLVIVLLFWMQNGRFYPRQSHSGYSVLQDVSRHRSALCSIARHNVQDSLYVQQPWHPNLLT